MKFLVILTVSVLIGCFAAYADAKPNANSWNARHWMKYINDFGSQENEPKFTELNMDSQLEILQLADLPSLLSIAEVNEQIGKLVAEIYQEKYASKTVGIAEHNRKNQDVIVHLDSIQIDKFDVISKFFKNFGHLIAKVEVISLADETDGSFLGLIKSKIGKRKVVHELKEVIKVVNERSRNSLKEMILSCNDQSPLKYVAQSFDNVEQLTLKQHGCVTLNSQILSLNEIFPKLRRLILTDFTTGNGLVVPFVLLEQLQVIYTDAQDYYRSDITDLIAKNPQMQSFTFKFGSPYILQSLSQYAANLEKLEIIHATPQNYGDKILEFKSVKQLKIYSSDNINEFTQHVTFEQLEEFHVNLTQENDTHIVPTAWIEFARKNVHLKKLNLDISFMNTAQLMSLTGIHQHLINAHFTVGTDVAAETIAAFLNGSNSLKTLTIPVRPFSSIVSLKIRIENNWKISKPDDSHLMFERK